MAATTVDAAAYEREAAAAEASVSDEAAGITAEMSDADADTVAALDVQGSAAGVAAADAFPASGSQKTKGVLAEGIGYVALGSEKTENRTTKIWINFDLDVQKCLFCQLGDTSSCISLQLPNQR